MRINEYNSLEDFMSQYTGVWAPSEKHWFGLDFIYNYNEYRLHTGSMYEGKELIDDHGVIHQFGLYKKKKRPSLKSQKEYELLVEADSIESLLNSKVIDNRPFKEIIMDDSTELIGQD